jgi:oligopeptide/dipeptide ABC transporter ATP-binding protein
MSEALLEVDGLVKLFPLPSGQSVQACKDVTITLQRGETLGLVGESGSGKTTLGRCILRLVEPTAGAVRLRGEDVLGLPKKVLRKRRARMQIVFQEPLDSLNPRLSIGRQLAEPLRLHADMGRAQRRQRVAELLDMVGLSSTVADAYPDSLSAGVAQRCSIARALATEPDLVVLDEPTSALAPEAEADLVALLRRLQQELGVSYLFISHDLSLIGEVCDRIAVMYLSQIVEMGTVAEVFGDPLHPYTRALLAASLQPDPAARHQASGRWERMGGEIPSPVDLPKGCYLAGRCLYVKDRCVEEPVQLGRLPTGRDVRCWRVLEDDLTEAEFEGVRRSAVAQAESAAVLSQSTDLVTEGKHE